MKRPFTVLASLPRNELSLAKAAFDSGVDAVKVHLNVVHRASGTRFGSWRQERARIIKILAAANCPIGMMPGSATTATPEEIAQAARAGIDFLDIYDYEMPCWMLSAPMKAMVAVGPDFTLAGVAALKGLGARYVEASIMKPADYGKPLTVGDLERYAAIVAATPLPVIVPSQKAIQPADLAALKKTGVRGVVLGAVVLGMEPRSLRQRLPAYIDAA